MKDLKKLCLTHTVRTVKELAYFDTLNNLNDDEIYSHVTQGKFYYFNTVTQKNGKEQEELLIGLKIINYGVI